MKPLPLFVPPEERFDCHRCGACCRGPEGVAVSGADLVRLEGWDWSTEGPRFADGPSVTRLDEATGEFTTRLRQRPDGACIFLDSDGLCLVEKRLGHEAKPLRCRLFPLRFTEWPDGERSVSVSPRCRSLHRSFERGSPVGVEKPVPVGAIGKEELGDLLEEAPIVVLTGESFLLAPGRPLSWPECRVLLEDLVSAANMEEPLEALPWRVMRAIRRIYPDPPPPFPYEGPPDTPLFEALLVAGEFLAPVARDSGRRLLAAGLEELRRYGAWRRTARSLEPQAARFCRTAFRSFVREGLPLRYPDLVGGAGYVLVLALSIAAAAARLGEVRRAGSKGNANEANEVAREASFFAEDPVPRPVVAGLREAFARVVFDAAPPGR